MLEKIPPNPNLVLQRDNKRTSGLCMFGEVIYAPNGYWGPYTGIDYTLFICLSGQGNVRIDGKNVVVPPAFVVLERPGHEFLLRFSSKMVTHQAWCSVEPKLTSEALKKYLEKAPVCAPMSQTFHRLLDSGFSMKRPVNEVEKQTLESVGFALLWEYCRMSAASSSEIHSDSPISRAIDYMETHYAEEDCLAKSLKASGITQWSLLRQFRKSLDTTTERYLWRLRTERGMALLAESDMTVSEIANQCGFKTPFHFSRLVSRQQGCSPKALRKMLDKPSTKKPKRRIVPMMRQKKDGD